MVFAHTIGNIRYTFDSLRELLGKATPLRSGDVLAGVAAESAEERVAAQFTLADLPLTHFLSEHVAPHEAGEVTRLIADTHDAQAFAPIRGFTVGEIGSLLQAELSVILMGERPSLSSPDSLGSYITWQPQPGRTDAECNCISNIRAEGLGYTDAAGQIMNCLAVAKRHKLTGTALADAARKLWNGLPDGREP